MKYSSLIVIIMSLLIISCGDNEEKNIHSSMPLPKPDQSLFSIEDIGTVREGQATEKQILVDGNTISRIVRVDRDNNGTFELLVQDFKLNNQELLLLVDGKPTLFSSNTDTRVVIEAFSKDSPMRVIGILSPKNRTCWIFMETQNGEFLPASQDEANDIFKSLETHPGINSKS